MQIKICEKCFVCHSIVSCQYCFKCTKCCPHSACRGQTSEFLENLARSRSRSKNNSNFKRRLCPPLLDPAKTYKISHGHKLLCQSSQEQLPVGGIASAYRQECSRVGPKSNISRVFQPTFPSPKTQQQMETNTGSEQSKLLPQCGEIQDGDTGNHQDIPPTRGVDHLSRLQRRLLPHTNTGTIQEISEISCPGPNLPVQSSAFWPVHGPHGVHCISERGKTDGRTQGYKDPPVPRRLVGESRIQTTLSHTYTDPDQNVSGSRLASKHGEIRTGTKASFQLCRLSIRPQVRSSQTDTGPVAKPSGQSANTLINAGLSGPAVHVPDRFINSDREASSPWPTTHETHSVASQKQLEGTGISGEDYPSTQILAPTLTMVARRKQRVARSTITPHKTCSANIYRRIKRRVGHSLRRAHCKRVLVGAGKQVAHQLSGTKSSVPSFERVPRTLRRQDGVSGNRQHYSGSLHKQGRRHEVGLSMCSPVENLDLVFPETTLKARHIPGRLNVIADKLSRLGQTIQTERSLLPEIFHKLCNRWHQPQIDLFATRYNHKLPRFVSPVPDSLAVAVDALTLPWENLDANAFPPTAILRKVVEKLLDSPCKRLILIAPGWPNMPWFWDLVTMSSQVPLSLPILPNLLTQPFNQIPHRSLTSLNLHAWPLEPQQSKNRASLRQWQQELRLLKEDQPDQSMRQSGPFLQSGASLIRWNSTHHL